MKGILGVSSIEMIEWKGRAEIVYKGQPLPDPDESMNAPDGGSIMIELNSGAVLVFWTSEWGGLEYYAPRAEGE